MIKTTKIGKTSLLVMGLASLGGVLYGYDLGVIAGALPFMKGELSLNPSEMSLIVAAVLGGGSLATLFSGPFADRYGRRFSMILSAVVFIVGVAIIVFSSGFLSALAGRLVQGVGVGIITIVTPLYIVEVMPAEVRGRSVTLFQLCLTFGILLGYVVDYAFTGSNDWRAMFATAFIPAGLFLLGGFILPKSPRWLYRRGRFAEARAFLLKMHTVEAAEQTFNDIKALADQHEGGASTEWRRLLQPGYRKAFFLALAIGVLTQLTGVNVLLQFNTLILHHSGLTSGASAVLGSVGIGAVNFVITIIALSLIDKLGRKPLLIMGTAGAMLALLFIGVVHAATAPSLFQGYATLGGFVAFIVFYAVGPGVVVWLAVSEIMPLAIRAKGMGIALFANSLASAGLAALFESIVNGIGYSGIFFILAFFTLMYLLIAIFPLPETKDRSLEQIERHFLGGRADD